MVNSLLYKTYLHILLVIQSLSSHAKVMFSVYWKISVFSKSQVKNQVIFYVLKLPNIGNHLYIWRRIVVSLKSSRKTDIYTNFIQFQNNIQNSAKFHWLFQILTILVTSASLPKMIDKKRVVQSISPQKYPRPSPR